MNVNEIAQVRILKCAKAIKAYFEKKLMMPLELLSDAPTDKTAGDVQFSMTMSNYGLWGVRSPEPLSSADHSEIYEMFHSVLGSFKNFEQRRDELQRLETQLSDRPDNVLQFRRILRKKAESDDNYIPSVPAAAKARELRRDCLVESPYLSEIHKMSFELHSHSGRYAFLEFRDLDAEKRVLLDELISLGAATLFVPDILTLTAAEQKALRLLMNADGAQRPLLMVGTTLPYADLRRAEGVDLELLTILSGAYIKLTRPFGEYRDQGLIHYFLDSLSESPS